MLILAVEALFLFLHSFVDKEADDEDSDGNEAIAQFVAVFGNFGKQLLFAFDAGDGGQIVSDGGKDGVPTEYAAPCGVCRQVMMEFCDPETFQVILVNSPDDYKIFTLEELLPGAFTKKDITKATGKEL